MHNMLFMLFLCLMLKYMFFRTWMFLKDLIEREGDREKERERERERERENRRERERENRREIRGIECAKVKSIEEAESEREEGGSEMEC